MPVQTWAHCFTEHSVWKRPLSKTWGDRSSPSVPRQRWTSCLSASRTLHNRNSQIISHIISWLVIDSNVLPTSKFTSERFLLLVLWLRMITKCQHQQWRMVILSNNVSVKLSRLWSHTYVSTLPCKSLHCNPFDKVPGKFSSVLCLINCLIQLAVYCIPLQSSTTNKQQ